MDELSGCATCLHIRKTEIFVKIRLRNFESDRIFGGNEEA